MSQQADAGCSGSAAFECKTSRLAACASLVFGSGARACATMMALLPTSGQEWLWQATSGSDDRMRRMMPSPSALRTATVLLASALFLPLVATSFTLRQDSTAGRVAQAAGGIVAVKLVEGWPPYEGGFKMG
jgi:hypothetical protein